MRLSRIYSLLTALALFAVHVPTAHAIDTWPPTRVSIAGDLKYKPFTLVRLKAENVDAKAGVVWRVYPSTGVQRATSPRGLLEFVAPPGKYQVDLLVIRTGENGIDVEESTTNVEIEGASPQGPPAPDAPKVKPDPVNALGRIQFGTAGCTATIIGPRRADGRWDVLTAAHCINRVGDRGAMRLKDGRTLRIQVVAKNEDADCAWCVTDENFADLAYAEIAKEVPAPGTPIWHMGYGVDRPGNREDGVTVGPEDSNGQIRMSISVSSGDSGGGMFRADTGELISVVCCTAQKGARAAVWGSSPLSARKLRPGAVADETWTPVEIPLLSASPADAPKCCPGK